MARATPALVVVAVLSMAAPVLAQARVDAGAPASGARMAPPGVQALARGNAAYVARDWAAATTAFREAQQHAEQRVQALLGVAHCLAQQGNAEGALAAFREAATASNGANVSPSDRARALQAVATQLEAMTRWSDALAAWQEWVTYADAHPTVCNPAVGRARVQAIQARDERERAESQVRTRIEERRRRNAQNPQPGQGHSS
jgi:tetratricopeptide (TPR) repeat protein